VLSGLLQMSEVEIVHVLFTPDLVLTRCGCVQVVSRNNCVDTLSVNTGEQLDDR
jgi:hypothetical protein